jgi:hypothetical protein
MPAPTLTATLRQVADLRGLPQGERAAVALALVPALDDVLTRVTPDTAIRVWLSLARAAGRQIATAATVEDQRAATLAALADEPVDWRALVRSVTADVAAATDRQRRTIAAARAADVPVSDLARLAGVTRQTVYDWTRG